MINCAEINKNTLPSHLSGVFYPVPQSRSKGYAPSSQDKNRSEICDPSVNKYWGTGSNHQQSSQINVADDEPVTRTRATSPIRKSPRGNTHVLFC